MNNSEIIPQKSKIKKPGLLKRIIARLDCAMKQKADAQRQNSNCCGGKEQKDGRCC